MTARTFVSPETRVGEDLHKLREPPIVVDTPIERLLVFHLLCGDHLLLFKIADHHRAFNQRVER